MKPLLLTIQAFGPFAALQKIDFTQLGSNPLFLINGPTGSGKSTILDAICFALYGQTTGGERDASQMRCDYSEPDLLTEITLDFKLKDKIYRVRRSPTQERAKARGDGTTTQQSEATLWLLDGSDEGTLIVPKKVREANEAIEDLIGLDVEQFRQVMILPQGKFRELLMADSRDRENIFGQLFQTQIYKTIEERLKSKASDIKQRVEQHQNEIRGILKSAELSNEEQVKEELEELNPNLDLALEGKNTADSEKTKALKAQEKAIALTIQFNNLASKQSSLTQKEDFEPAIKLKQQTLKSAIEAQKIHHLFENENSESNSLTNLEEKSELAIKSLKFTKKEQENASQALIAAEQAFIEVDALKASKIKLSQYQEKTIELVKAKEVFSLCESNYAKSEQSLELKRNHQKEFLNEQTLLANELKIIAKSLEPLANRQIELASFSQKVEQSQRLGKLKVELTDLEKLREQYQLTVEDNHVEFKQVSNRAIRIELSWHNGQASLLAKELKEDQPCPVCGSKSHPSPALVSENDEHDSTRSQKNSVATKEQVDIARSKEDGARKTLQDSETKLANQINQVEHKKKYLIELTNSLAELADESLATLTSRLRGIEIEVKNLLGLQRKQQTINERLAELEKLCSEINDEIAQLLVESNSHKDSLIQARSNKELLEKGIPDEFQDAKVLSDALEITTNKIKKISSALDVAKSSHQDKRSSFDKATSKHESFKVQMKTQKIETDKAKKLWQDALNKSEHADVNAFNKALLNEKKQSVLKNEIDNFSSDLAEFRGAVNQLESDLKNLKRPDMKQLEQILESKQQLSKTADDEWLELDRRNKNLLNIKKKLKIAHTTNEKLEAEYAIFGTLSDVASGKTGNKISFQRFILSVLLDDVLVQASERLNIMSSGRYRLIRKEEKAKGGGASGLDLEVEDSYTGKSRGVATLSGGESFMAALALALGLSDVVQSYAGGITLDTLFIDEGFGSLDTESLDLAIKTLVDLQASGRMIGIISHVTELKEQMALRVDVDSGRAGSRIRCRNSKDECK